MSDTGRIGWVGIDRHWLSDPKLSDSDLRLMLWLTSHNEDFRSRLHIKACAEQIGWSRDRVKRSLVSLESLGLITTEILKDHASGARTKISIHQDIWSDRCASRQGTPVPCDKAQAVPCGEAPPYSTSSGEESTVGAPKPPASTEVEVVPEWESVFVRFWELYPRKVGKVAAKRAFKTKWKIHGRHPIAQGFRAWMSYWDLSNTQQKYIPHASSWLNGELYMDDPGLPAAPKKETPTDIINRIRNRDDS